MILYVTVQGGKWEEANTIYVWPCLSITEDKRGFEHWAPKKYRCVVALFWLFWTVGIAFWEIK